MEQTIGKLFLVVLISGPLEQSFEIKWGQVNTMRFVFYDSIKTRWLYPIALKLTLRSSMNRLGDLRDKIFKIA